MFGAIFFHQDCVSVSIHFNLATSCTRILFKYIISNKQKQQPSI
ncbi:unnamed protein product [Amoebophrya sp. A25]|nr:unnamed protein product [Amoebophrya sp. A25]|eukprot:GSA25T00010775001.1